MKRVRWERGDTHCVFDNAKFFKFGAKSVIISVPCKAAESRLVEDCASEATATYPMNNLDIVR